MARSFSRAIGLAAVALALALAFGTAQTPAWGDDEGERYRYAEETANLGYEAFIGRQEDFRHASCGVPPWDPSRGNCTKPTPYDAFDWTDDGCSGREQFGAVGKAGSNIYRDIFNGPCRQHDFGYRNFGKGLALDRSEDRRKKIDDHFLVESGRVCAQKYGVSSVFSLTRRINLNLCLAEAGLVYAGVRNATRGADSWSQPCSPGQCHELGTSDVRQTQPPPDPPSAAAPSARPHDPIPPAAPPTVVSPPAGNDDAGGDSGEPTTPPSTVREQAGSNGSPTFSDVTNASGSGPRIPAMAYVEISCKTLPARTISSAQPDGYWYRVASAPWNNAYYAVANTFWNGDVPGQKPYTHNTDWAVPDC